MSGNPDVLETYMQLGEKPGELIVYPTWNNVQILTALGEWTGFDRRDNLALKVHQHMGRLLGYGILQDVVFCIGTTTYLGTPIERRRDATELTLLGKSCLMALKQGMVWSTRGGILKEETNDYFRKKVLGKREILISRANYTRSAVLRHGEMYELTHYDLAFLASTARITRYEGHEKLQEEMTLWRLQRDD